jgi:hypothetical protein
LKILEMPKADEHKSELSPPTIVVPNQLRRDRQKGAASEDPRRLKKALQLYSAAPLRRTAVCGAFSSSPILLNGGLQMVGFLSQDHPTG